VVGLDDDPVGLVVGRDVGRLLLSDRAVEDHPREREEDLLLDDSIERSSTVLRREPGNSEPLLGNVVNLNLDALGLLESQFNLMEANRYDPSHVLLRQGSEDDGLVESVAEQGKGSELIRSQGIDADGKGENEDVHELGREVGRDGTGDESLDLGLDRSLANLAEVRRTQVGGEEDDGVLEVDNSLRRIKGTS
jgi:hypothetical protein